MNAGTMETDAKPIKLEEEEPEEGEIVQSDVKTSQQWLVVHSPSSSLPSSVDDSSVLRFLDAQPVTDADSTVASLRAQLELASYEYTDLEVCHKKLTEQYRDIRTLCSTYDDVIHGYALREEQTASIEQLRTEAGREGLRAKALEADVLRPIVRESGGLQALMSLVQSVQSLVQQAGGLRELEELVSDAQLLRASVSKVGGLEGLGNLVNQVNVLRSKEQECLDLRDKMNDLDAFARKAAKYDKLMQAFTEIQNTPINVAQARPDRTEVSMAPVALPAINPARASRITSTPLQEDPDRDLYEAPPLCKSYKKTGSNDIPLGRSRGPDWGRLKRKLSDAPPADVAKRPRVDIGRASVLVQTSLAGPPGMNREWLARFNRLTEKTPSHIPEERGVSTTDGSARRSRSPMIKREDVEYSARKAHGNPPIDPSGFQALGNRDFTHTSNAVVGGYPIAFWIGSIDPKFTLSVECIKSADQMPWSLVEFLGGKLSRYINNASIGLLNTMSSNANTCVLRYLDNDRRHPAERTNWRVCSKCYPISNENSRPCVWLRRVRGVLTLVFMPLSDEKRCGVSWREKGFWLKFVE